WFSDDTPKRFEAYGWHVIRDVDGHDPEAIDKAIHEAKSVNNKPTLICCKTIIGYGAPNLCGSHDCHGAPLGEDEIKATRENLGWPYPPFEIPDEIYQAWDAREAGKAAEEAWNERFAAYKAEYPELAAEFERRMKGELPGNWEQVADDYIKATDEAAESPATRQASQKAITAYAKALPEFLGGSADLTPSNLTAWPEAKTITDTVADGNYISYGVREFAMSAIMNGVALHGGFIPFGGTFLMFSEYARNALRMAALMGVQSIFVYTHDSIGLGEDGPTHQPIEQISTLRLMPNMHTWRPCDAVETAVAWRAAVERKDGPTSLVFSRQGLPHQARSDEQLSLIAHGGYILKDCGGKPEAIIIATGSEVALAMAAAEELEKEGKKVRVVSMPCTEVFDLQDHEYRESVLPSDVTARVAVEAGVTDFWWKYVGSQGRIIGIDRFGESAPANVLFPHFGFTVDHVVSAVKGVMG
ncbi:MAG TPA: transketolase, partial [Thiolapillus brandeum]|nr:transketolase [Thiolapillus brandeum]